MDDLNDDYDHNWGVAFTAEEVTELRQLIHELAANGFATLPRDVLVVRVMGAAEEAKRCRLPLRSVIVERLQGTRELS